MASWYGHNDDEMPSEVREYFMDGRHGPGQSWGKTNVRILIFDSKGKFVERFDSLPSRGPWERTAPAYMAEKLKAVREKLGVTGTELRELSLPGLQGQDRGIRVFVRLDDPGMRAYNAPVVEVTYPSKEAWAALASAKTIDASVLFPCFQVVYPPGVMERVDPKTKVRYAVAKAEGTLTLEGDVLRGKVKLTDEGPDGFSYEGMFAAVVTRDGGEVRSLKGTFEATYTRYDRMKDFTREMALTAVFESLPD